MNQIFDVDAWRQVVVNSLTELGADIGGFLPNLIGTLFILLLGWLVSKLVEVVARRVLQKLGLDRATSRLRVSETLNRAGIASSPSWLLGRLLFWTLMLTFVLSAVETLGLRAVTSTIDRLIAYLPNVIAAGLLVVLGLFLGRLARNVIASGAAAANLEQPQRIGAAAGGVIALFVFVLALEQLGVETALLITALTTLIAGACLAVGVAFALGARPLVTHILAGHFLRQTLLRGSELEVQGRKGTVERVGPLDTLLRDGEHAWSVPNGRLMEETLLR